MGPIMKMWSLSTIILNHSQAVIPKVLSITRWVHLVRRVFSSKSRTRLSLTLGGLQISFYSPDNHILFDWRLYWCHQQRFFVREILIKLTWPRYQALQRGVKAACQARQAEKTPGCSTSHSGISAPTGVVKVRHWFKHFVLKNVNSRWLYLIGLRIYMYLKASPEQLLQLLAPSPPQPVKLERARGVFLLLLITITVIIIIHHHHQQHHHHHNHDYDHHIHRNILRPHSSPWLTGLSRSFRKMTERGRGGNRK